MSQLPYTQRSLYHGWLPQNPEIHRAFLEKHIASTIYRANADPNKWVRDFITAIKTDPVMKPLYPLIFEQVNKDERWEASDERFRVRDIDHLQRALDSVLQGPPEVLVVKNEQGVSIGEPIGVPIFLVLDLLSNTGAGYDLFRTKEFDQAAINLLNNWGTFLKSAGSNSTLTTKDNGWMGPLGLQVLQSGLQGQTFEYTYGVDPKQAQGTYKSWDAFFVRPFQDIDKRRPVRSFRGEKKVTAIHNACESTSLRIAYNVQRNDTFWLKGQNYSLYDMLGGSTEITPESLSGYADRFIGGSVYQAFLSPQDYHHWHSPIKGTVVVARRLPGTYYAVLPDDGAPAGDPDYKEGDPHGALIRSQPWLTVSAARGVFIIQPYDTPDEPSDLEWVAVIVVGMVEVSTIDILDKFKQPNVPVEAGEELGMFHFGGSTHAVILKAKPKKKVVFKDTHDIEITPGQHRWVRSIIGRLEDEEQE